jgi:hypothetical protein
MAKGLPLTVMRDSSNTSHFRPISTDSRRTVRGAAWSRKDALSNLGCTSCAVAEGVAVDRDESIYDGETVPDTTLTGLAGGSTVRKLERLKD